MGFASHHNISVLIGADQYYNFVFSKKVNGVSLIPSKLGNMLSGTLPKIAASGASSVFVKNVTVLQIGSCESDLDVTLQTFWDMDAIGIKHSDKKCVWKNLNSVFILITIIM